MNNPTENFRSAKIWLNDYDLDITQLIMDVHEKGSALALTQSILIETIDVMSEEILTSARILLRNRILQEKDRILRESQGIESLLREVPKNATK